MQVSVRYSTNAMNSYILQLVAQKWKPYHGIKMVFISNGNMQLQQHIEENLIQFCIHSKTSSEFIYNAYSGTWFTNLGETLFKAVLELIFSPVMCKIGCCHHLRRYVCWKFLYHTLKRTCLCIFTQVWQLSKYIVAFDTLKCSYVITK